MTAHLSTAPNTSLSHAAITRRQAVTATMLVLLSVMSYFQRTSMSIAAPGIAERFGIPAFQLGAIYSAFTLGYTLAMIPGGRLADRIGPARTLGMVAFCTAALSAAAALAGLPWLGGATTALGILLAVRFALGLSTAPLYPAASRLNASFMPPARHGLVQGWISAGAGIGGALSPFLLPWIIRRLSWQSAFLATAAGTLLIAAAWRATNGSGFPAPAAPLPERADRGDWRHLLANRQLLFLTAGYFATCYFEYLFFYWTYYYLLQVRHASEHESVVFTSILFASWTLFAPLGGMVSDRLVKRYGLCWGRRLVPLSVLPAGALLTAIAIQLQNIAATGLLLALALGLAASSDAAFWAASIELSGSRTGMAGGILNTGGNLGGLVAPMLTPWIATRFGWSAGLLVGCGIVLAGSLVWYQIKPLAVPYPGDRR